MPPKKKLKTGPLAFPNAHPFVRPAVEDKIYACIMGYALGDTIGLYTEFLTKEESAGIYFHREFQLTEPATELYPDKHRCA
jgi:ADP-ribosylglycohydrolase